LIDKVKGFAEETIKGTHYTFDDMVRRLKQYRAWNNSTIADPAVSDFFKSKGTKVHFEDCTKVAEKIR
jgi:hypothetical protein